METIRVYYKPLGLGFHHKYIVYENNDGEQFVAHGGPRAESFFDVVGEKYYYSNH